LTGTHPEIASESQPEFCSCHHYTHTTGQRNSMCVWLIVWRNWMSCLKISATCSPSTLQRPSPGTHRVSPYPHLIKCPPSTHGILVWWSDATRINAQPFSRTSHCGRLPHNLSCRQWSDPPFPSSLKGLEDNSKSNPLSRYYVPNQQVGHRRSKITKNASPSC